MWETKQVGGCMHLLQIWAWSSFSMVRPSALQVIQHGHLPYGCKWIVPKSYKGSPRHCIRLYRDDLDRMTESQNPSHNVPTTGYTPTAHDWGIV
ncbi:unnamed protein product, partial [Cuscuta epithymum]